MDQFLKTHGKSVKDFDFEPGRIVLYRNTRVEGGEPEVKTKVPRTDGGGPANKRRVVYSGRVGRNGVGDEICCVPNYTLFSSH